MPFGAFFFRMKRNYYLFYGLLFFLALFYAFVNPFERNTNLPGCFIYEHTGIFCPGCGLQRALHAFFTGKIMLAFRMNLLITIALIILCIDFILLVFDIEKLRIVPRVVNSHVGLIILVIILVLFLVFRNIHCEYLIFLKPSL
jgi:hypothetical protein